MRKIKTLLEERGISEQTLREETISVNVEQHLSCDGEPSAHLILKRKDWALLIFLTLER